MRTTIQAALWAVLAATSCISPTAHGDELRIQKSQEGAVDAYIKGVKLRLRVDYDLPAAVILNPAAAAKVGLEGDMFAMTAKVGPVRLKGRSSKAVVVVEDKTFTPAVFWWERDFLPGVDGVISAAALPFDRVTVDFGAPAEGLVPHVVPVQAHRSGLFATGPEGVLMRFSVTKTRTLATASAGALLSRAFNGAYVGASRMRVIAFGVARPVQELRLSTPAKVGGLQLESLDVREIGTGGGEDSDPDEVVVVGNAKASGPAWLTVAHDTLEPCRSISYDGKTSALTLLCLPAR